MAGPKVSQQNIAQSVTASAGMPFSHSASWFPRKATYAPGHPSDVNVIHQTRPHSSIAPWSSPDAHVPTVGAFGSGQGSAWAPCPMHNKLWYTVYSDTFSSEPALTSWAIWTTVGFYAKRCIRIVGVHQAAWHTRCDDKVSLHFNDFFFFACPVEPTRCGAAHSKYCGKREHQCGEDVVYLKTETKSLTQNAYLLHFLEGHLSSLHSRLTQESPKPCQINVRSTLKKTCNY